MEPILTKFDTDDLDNIAKRWDRWLENLKRYLRVKKITDDNLKKDYLFLYGGSGLEDAYEPVANPHDNFDGVTTKLTEVFKPKINANLHIHQFRKLTQYDDENFDAFVIRCRDKAKLCSFDNTDKELEFQLVSGCKSMNLKEKALAITDLNLATIITLGRAEESIRKQLDEIRHKHKDNKEESSEDEPAQVNMLKRRQNDTNQRFDKNMQQTLKDEGKCFRCGGSYPHKNSPCPAKDVECYRCGNFGHYKQYCLSKTVKNNNNAKTNSSKHARNDKSKEEDKLDKILRAIHKKKVRTHDSSSDTDSDTVNHLWKINSKRKKTVHFHPEQMELKVNGKKVNFCIDTGSTKYNIMDKRTYESLSQAPPLKHARQRICPYESKTPIKLLGKAYMKVSDLKGKEHFILFLVTNGKGGNLIGCPSALKMGLIHFGNKKDPVEESTLKDRLIKNFPRVFDSNIGLVKNFEAKLHINKAVKPVKQKLRPIPVYLEDAIKKEIKNLESQGKIEKVNGPTEWVASIVPVVKKQTKDGVTEVRICTDSRDANQAIIRERYKMPTVNELITRLSNAKFFTKFDLKKAYFQISLNKNSRYITAFNTPFGIYQWCVLNMGLCASSEIFQKVIEQILDGLPGQFSISDDLCVFGSTEQEHFENVVAVLKRLEEHGLTVNKDKCSIGEKTMEFFGFQFSEHGMSVTEEKFQALLNAKEPRNAKELRSLLGLAQYCERAAIANMAKLVHPLRKLLKKKVPFVLTDEHRAALKEFKANIVKYAMGYFRKDWTNRLIIDASPMGLGLIHTQYNPKDHSQKHIVDLGSRTLTDIESRYHQTELEALALVWAVEKRHYYIYNVEFEVVTDNKAVQLIYGKHNSVQKGRIQRWGLRLMPYRMKLIHQEGSNNIADYLSRHPSTVAEKRYERWAEEQLNMLVSSSLPKAIKRRVIAKESRNDRRIQNAIAMVRNKKHMRDLNFFKIAHELAITKDGLLLKGNRIVVPRSLQRAIVNIAHQGHQGIEKTKQLARRHIWFPNMSKMLERAVKECPSCRTNTKERKFNPVKSTELPLGPWRELAIDYYGPIWGKYVVVLIDYFSRYPLAKVLGSTNAKTLIPYLDEVFALFGIPKRLKSDNGPPFNSREFAAFCDANNIEHDKITPYWPRANGLVEAFMKNVTKCVKNSQVSGRSFEEELKDFLRSYRATPHSSTGEAPNALLFRDKPSTVRLPNALADDEITSKAREKDKRAKIKQASNQDKKLKAKQHEYKVGDSVLLLQTVKGKATTVYDQHPYKIIEIKGSMVTIKRGTRTLARNSSLLKLAKMPKGPISIDPIEPPGIESYADLRAAQLEQLENLRISIRQREQEYERQPQFVAPNDDVSDENDGDDNNENEPRRSTRQRRAPQRFVSEKLNCIKRTRAASESTALVNNQGAEILSSEYEST